MSTSTYRIYQNTTPPNQITVRFYLNNTLVASISVPPDTIISGGFHSPLNTNDRVEVRYLASTNINVLTVSLSQF
jgi:hypothetical protein